MVLHIGGGALSGQLQALEGGRGLMRIALDDSAEVREGEEGVLEMHDGARFRVSVQERLAPRDGWRIRLIGRA